MDKNTLIQLAKDTYRLSLLFPNREPLRYRMREAADDIISVFIMKRKDYLYDLGLILETMDSFLEIAVCQDWTSPVRINELRVNYRAAAAELILMREQDKHDIQADQVIEISRDEPEAYIEPEFTPEIPAVPVSEDGIIYPPMTVAISETIPLMSNQEALTIAIEEPGGTGLVKGQIEKEAMGAVMPHHEGRDGINIETQEGGDDDDEGLISAQITRQNRILTFLKEKGGAQVWEIQKIFPDISKRTIRRDFVSMLKQGLIERYGERNTIGYKLKVNLS